MAEKSALKLIAGRDALLEYTPKSYPAKTYVEYNGFVYKSKIVTSNTFISTEWDLISDLREVRVNNITDRNALTGNTPTSGTTGIHIPILDNTNVLVLNASADPQVGSNKFARYNYQQSNNSFLLLQISTGSTSTNVSDYNLLTNKPSIISGVTANAGAGLTGGGVFNGSVPPNRATFTFSHADTSSQANINASGYTYVQKMKFDTYGHVTGVTTSTWTQPTGATFTTNNTGTTYLQNITVNNGHVVSATPATWFHPDTSSQGNVNNTGNTVIQSIFVDSDGHVTGINSKTISVSGGTGGVNFNVAGNSGGSFAMPNGGTLQITGGSNIQTVSSGGGLNVGLRVSFQPAGANTQLQYNNSGALAGSANLTFASNTLTVPLVKLSSTPATGSTGTTFILMRDSATGNLKQVTQSYIRTAIAGSVNQLQFNGGSNNLAASSNLSFTGGTTLITNKLAVTANPLTGITSDNILVRNSATGLVKQITQASLTTPPAGSSTQLQFNNSGVFGASANLKFTGGTTLITNSAALTTTPSNDLAGSNIMVRDASTGILKQITQASLIVSPVGANGYVQFRDASGKFNSSANFTFATGTSTLFTSNLNLGIPATGTTSNVFLTRDSSTGNIESVPYSAIPAPPINSIQFNNGSGFGGDSGWVFDSSAVALTLGSRTGSTGTNSFTIGTNNSAGQASLVIGANNGMNGGGFGSLIVGAGNKFIDGLTYKYAFGINHQVGSNYSAAFGSGNIVTGQSGVAFGISNKAYGVASFAGGAGTQATNTGSFAIGNTTKATGFYSYAEGVQTTASGSQSHAEGGSNTASGSTSHVEGDHNTAGGTSSHAQGTFTFAKGNYSFAGGVGFNASVPILAAGLGSINLSTNTNAQIAGNGALGNYAAIVGGTDSHIASTVTTGSIFGGYQGKILGGADQGSVIVGGNSNQISGGTRSFIAGGSTNKITGNNNNAIVGGTVNTIKNNTGTANNSQIFGGDTNSILGSSTSNLVVGGNNNTISGNTAGSTITYSGIFAGTTNKITYVGSQNAIIAGNTNSITGNTINFPTNSVIVGGFTNKISNSVARAAIVGGQNITLSGSSQNDNVVVPNLMVWNTPTTPSTSDRILTWNSTTRKVGSSSQYLFNGTANAVTLGSRAAGTVGTNSEAIGNNNLVTSNYSLAVGQNNIISGSTASMAIGTSNNVLFGFAIGNSNFVNTSTGTAIGFLNVVSGQSSVALGQNVIAGGLGSFAGGVGNTSPSSFPVRSMALGSFNWSYNDNVVGRGVNSLAQHSVILGGKNHTIGGNVGSTDSFILGGIGNGLTGTTSGIIGGTSNRITYNSTQAFIVGGSNITLTGISQNFSTVVDNLFIWSTPPAGGSNDVLTWNATTRRVGKVTQGSLSDERLKKDFKPLSGVVDVINKLSTVEFKYNEKNAPDLVNTSDYGLIAQEVESIFPYVVKDNLKLEGDDTQYKTVDYKKLVPVLFAAIKELNAKIEALEKKLNS